MCDHLRRCKLLTINQQRGFSLVEIMVGIAIGLLGVLIIMQVSMIFEGQKRTTTSGSNAQTTGAIAFYTLERDLRRAGFGFSDPSVLGCPIRRYFDGAPLPNAVVTPLTLTDGANGEPDIIQILASAKGNWSVPNRIVTEYFPTQEETFLNTTLGIDIDDLLLAFEPGKDCTMFQVTGPVDDNRNLVAGSLRVEHRRGASQGEGIWNPDNPADLFPAEGYGVGSLVFNLGALINNTYSLDAMGNLLMRDTAGVKPIASDIVNLQAEYGFDTTEGAQADARVGVWSPTMIDADGSGVVNDAGDIARIVAVRVALVARSALIERPDAAGVCDITISEPVGTREPNSPTWAGGRIDVSNNPDGSANPNWQCYRYKTFENIIPLRNLIWREQNAA